MIRQENESAIEFLRRIVGWLDHEPESLLESLPSVEAIIDYAALWDAYGTEFMSGIEEGILADGDDPKLLIDFVKKHKLDWDLSWVHDRKAA